MSDSNGRDDRKLEILVKGATISTRIMRIAWALIIISVLAGLITTGIGRLDQTGTWPKRQESTPRSSPRRCWRRVSCGTTS